MTPWSSTVGDVTVRVETAREEPACYATPRVAAAFMLETQPMDGREHFRAIYLDVRHCVLGVYMVSIGSLGATLVHPRELFRPAIVAGASGVVVSHNHPSGDPEPSAEDLALTRRLAAAGTLLGIEVLDHIVTGSAGRFVSLKERGAL